MSYAPMVERNPQFAGDAVPHAAPTHERDEVPWLPTPRSWMNSLSRARVALLVPLVGAVLGAAFLDWIQGATSIFSVLAVCVVLHALLHRLAALRATECLVLSLVCDIALLAWLVFHCGGLSSALLPTLLLPGVAAFFALKLELAVIPAISTVVALWVIGSRGDPPPHTIPSYAALLAVIAIAVAAMAGAYAQRRRERYLEHRVQELDHSLEDAALERALPRVAEWEEIEPVRSPSPTPVLAARSADGPKLSALADLLAGELRDPAGTLRARAEALRTQTRDRARRDELLPEIERLLKTAERLDDVRLTLGILANATAERSLVAGCDVRALIVDLRAQLADAFERDGLRLRIEAPRNLPFAALTADEFRLLLTRLLESSRRTALARGKSARVGVRFVPSAESIVVEVEDNLAASDEDTLTAARSEGAADPATERRPGLSLAVAVSRHLLSARGGDIEIDRRKGGGGLLLRLRIPTTREARTH